MKEKNIIIEKAMQDDTTSEAKWSAKSLGLPETLVVKKELTDKDGNVTRPKAEIPASEVRLEMPTQSEIADFSPEEFATFCQVTGSHLIHRNLSSFLREAGTADNIPTERDESCFFWLADPAKGMFKMNLRKLIHSRGKKRTETYLAQREKNLEMLATALGCKVDKLPQELINNADKSARETAGML
jgi:hypothetical protein